MNEQEQLIALCTRLGAPTPAAATTMAAQLSKRCDQLAAQRGLSRVEAMAYLLKLVTQGAQGQTPPGFEGTSRPPASGAK